MMSEDWNTGFDPYDTLLQCQHNIGELIKAANDQHRMIQQLINRYNTHEHHLTDLVKQHVDTINLLRQHQETQTNLSERLAAIERILAEMRQQ